MIQLTETIRLTVYDSRNFTLERLEKIKNPKTKEVVRLAWQRYGYYGKINQALNAALELSLKDDSIDTIHKLKERIQGARADLLEATKNIDDKLILELKTEIDKLKRGGRKDEDNEG